MFFEPALLSLITATFRGGRFKNLDQVHIKGWYLLILSAGLQVGLSWLKQSEGDLAKLIMEDYFFYLHLLSYLLLMGAIVQNIGHLSMKLFLFGLVLNFMVIFLNAGKMPVAIDGINGRNNSNIQIKVSDIKHEAMTENTRMPYLGDIIRIPPPYPLPKIISVGDLFLMAGVFIFFQENLIRRKPL